jgi:hypothetical protein
VHLLLRADESTAARGIDVRAPAGFRWERLSAKRTPTPDLWSCAYEVSLEEADHAAADGVLTFRVAADRLVPSAREVHVMLRLGDKQRAKLHPPLRLLRAGSAPRVVETLWQVVPQAPAGELVGARLLPGDDSISVVDVARIGRGLTVRCAVRLPVGEGVIESELSVDDGSGVATVMPVRILVAGS